MSGSILGSIPGLISYVTNQPPKGNSAFHPSGVGKRVPASAGKAKAGMVHSVSRCMRGVQVKLWDPLRTRAIPERLKGVITTRRYTNPRLVYLILTLLYTLFLNKCSRSKFPRNELAQLPHLLASLQLDF